MTPFRGFFINLDSNPTRLASMMEQLTSLGIASAYERFPAVNGADLGPEYHTQLDRGNLGLWITHERLIQANKSSDIHLHVLEDDALLPKDATKWFEAMLSEAESRFPDWDVLFTEVLLQLDVTLFQVLSKCRENYQERGKIELLSLKPAPFAGTSSIFINRRSIGKYLKVMTGGWAKGWPIDLYLRDLIRKGSLNAYVTMPFLTSLSSDTNESNISGRLSPSRLILNIYRRAAFKDADFKSLSEEMSRLCDNPKISGFAELYLKVLKFSLSEQYINF